MKKIVLMMMVIGSVVASYGAITIDWSASAGFYFNADPSVGILGVGTGNSTYAQLMYSADGVQDAGSVVAGQGIKTDGNGTGDDIYWTRLTITENGSLYSDFASFIAQENRGLVSGYAYALIFQDNNVQGGDWYYYTPMITLANTPEGNAGQSIEMNTDLTDGNAINSGSTVAQVIPEPATMLLFGIGGLGAWLLRRRQQA